MSEQTAAGMARAILDAHLNRLSYENMPGGNVASTDFAYAVQEELVGLFQRAGEGVIGGWKLGMTTAPMQRRTGISGPAAGAILRRRMHMSGAVLSAAQFMHMGLEGEIALRVSHPFPETEAIAAAQVRGRLDGVAAAFEITDDRNADWSRLSAAPLIADNIWNMGVVLGPARPLRDAGALMGRRGVVCVNDAVRDEGMSDDVGCDHLELVAWLAAHVAGRGLPLQPGQWIMTGSFVPTRFPDAGDRYRFTIDGLPSVEVAIAG